MDALVVGVVERMGPDRPRRVGLQRKREARVSRQSRTKVEGGLGGGGEDGNEGDEGERGRTFVSTQKLRP